MNPLEIPDDLIWAGKPEPLSPSQLALSSAEDVLIFDNNFDNELNFSDVDFFKAEHCEDENEECKQTALELLQDLQRHMLETEDLDDEANQWLNQSMNFSSMGMYVDDVPVRSGVQQPIKVEQTAQLIREFDSVFEVVELTHLTPPQTPPHSPSQSPTPLGAFNNNLKQHEFVFPSPQYVALQPSTVPIPIPPTPNNYYVFDGTTPAASPISQDIAHEMEVVEELVRARAENLADWTDEDDDDENSSQSASSSSASCSPRSELSYGESSNFSNDDDWLPTADADSTGKVSGATKTAAAKRRTRPYGRSSEDKKSRKKEQNKNAATRYRQKKKAEIEVALDEERDLLDIHATLEVKCADVKREIKYLKSLMRDLYKAKGIL